MVQLPSQHLLAAKKCGEFTVGVCSAHVVGVILISKVDVEGRGRDIQSDDGAEASSLGGDTE